MTMAASSCAVFFVFATLPAPRHHTQRNTVQPGKGDSNASNAPIVVACASRLCSGAVARIWREILFLVRHPLPLFGIGRRFLLDRNIGPYLGVFRVDAQPLFEARLGVRLDRIDRTFWLANPAIYAFVGMDDQHVLALVEAIHGADFHTIHQLTFDATFIDYIRHLTFLPDGQVAQSPTRKTVFAGCAFSIARGQFVVSCAMP